MVSPVFASVQEKPGVTRYNCLGEFVFHVIQEYNASRSRDLMAAPLLPEQFINVMDAIGTDGEILDTTVEGINNYDTGRIASIIKRARNDLKVMIPPEEIQRTTSKAVETKRGMKTSWYPKQSVDVRDEDGDPSPGNEGDTVFAVAPWKAFKTGALAPVKGKRWYHALRSRDHACLRYPVNEVTMDEVDLEKYPPGNCTGFHFDETRRCQCIPSGEITSAWARKKGMDWLDVEYKDKEMVDMNFASRYNAYLYSSPKEDYDEIEACLEALKEGKTTIITENLS